MLKYSPARASNSGTKCDLRVQAISTTLARHELNVEEIGRCSIAGIEAAYVSSETGAHHNIVTTGLLMEAYQPYE
jgi:hypothetical protein